MQRSFVPTMTLVGLPDAAVKESAERVRAAIKNSGMIMPGNRITINLAPADLRKAGPSYDLPIAIGLLTASEQIPVDALESALIVGELGLDGAVRHIRGVISIAALARERQFKYLFVPAEDAAEAALIPGVDVVPVSSLAVHQVGEPQLLRDLPIWNRRCWLRYAPRRFRCETCATTFVERVAWRKPGLDYTQRYEQFVYERTRREPLAQVAQTEGLTEAIVQGIFERGAKKRSLNAATPA